MKIPEMSGKELIVLLQKAGFKVIGQRGAHVSLRKGDRRLIIPYNKKLNESTIVNIIDQANLEAHDILGLLHGKKPKETPIEEGLEQELEDEPIPILNLGFWKESYYGLSWTLPNALLRILIGFLFIDFALGKSPWIPNFGWFESVVANNVAIPSVGWYQAFFTNVVQPNYGTFAALQFGIELFVGLSLLLGAFTVLGGYLGAAWVAWFAIGATHWPHEWGWSYIFWIAACLVVAATKSGRSLGVDLYLSDHFENNKKSKLAQFLNRFV